MRLFSVKTAYRKDPCNNAKSNMDLEPAGSRLPAAIAYTAAGCLIFAAGSQNVSHAWELGVSVSPFRGAVLALASVGATLLGPFAFLAAGRALARWRIGSAIVALILGCGCLAYASVNSLGFVAGSRDTSVAERTATLEARDDRRALAKAARDDCTTCEASRRLSGSSRGEPS